jgi:acyl-CoA synthetase (AMP-forming)/AMP-acid ligase II
MVAMPLFHTGGTGWALCGMSRGGHSIIFRDIDPVEFLRLIENHEITHTFVVPAVLMFLLAVPELAEADVSSLRTVFYGASPISEDVLVRSMHAFGCDFAQVYGLTETTGAITSLMTEDHDPDGPRSVLLRSAGRPFDHVELRIIDTGSGEDLPVGAVGEVWTRSDQNMLGYWNKTQETEAVLSEDGWFRTGDAGWLDADGYLFLHDRMIDVLVSKKRDRTLRQHSSQLRSASTARPLRSPLTGPRPWSGSLPTSCRLHFTTGSPVPCHRLQRVHATFTPSTAKATYRQLPG